MTPLEPDERDFIERMAQLIVNRRLSVPAVLFLESAKPLAFLGGQALHFLEPMVRTVVQRPEYGLATRVLEDRAKLEVLLRRIEALEEGHGQGPSDPPSEPPKEEQA